MAFSHLGPSRVLLSFSRTSFGQRFDARRRFCPVTAVTGRDGFAVDLTFVQTYSQAQGDV